MTKRTATPLLFLALLTFFTALTIINYQEGQRANKKLVLVNEFFLPLSKQLVSIYSAVLGLTAGNVSTYQGQIQKKFISIQNFLESDAFEKQRELKADLTAKFAPSKEAFIELLSINEKEKFEEAYTKVKSVLQNFIKKLDDESQLITTEVQHRDQRVLLANLILSLLVAVLGFYTAFLSYKVMNPLPQLISSIKMIQDGNFGQSLKYKANDTSEASELAREFNRMLEALRERDKKIALQQIELLKKERLAAVGQLSAEVVHEIRNPLNSISLNIDWLQCKLETISPEIKKTLVSVAREVERLHQITQNYLIRARVPKENESTTPINELIQEILSFERDEKNNIEITTHLSEQEIYVRTDRMQLKQAFLNVFQNAKESMPKGGNLTVKTEVKGNISLVQFTDTGYGMNETTRSKTFHPFFTTKSNGTGLGLTLTKNIIEEANGTIRCESRFGQGTTFTLQFPV